MADRESASVKVGILTVSDSCYNGSANDRSGENLKHLVESEKYIKGTVVTKDIIPDEFEQIKAKLLHWSDHVRLDLVLTTGGTGFSARDVTPEATKAVIEKEALGMTVAMLKASLDITPLAMLSRLTCGTRGKTLIINLPGSMKGSAECFQIASAGIPHAVDLLRGYKSRVEKTHSTLQAQGVKSVHSAHHAHSQFGIVHQPSQGCEIRSLIEGSQETYPSQNPGYLHPEVLQNITVTHTQDGSVRGAGLAAARKPTKNFTSELPLRMPTAMTAVTHQFWKFFVSLSEAGQLSLINSLLSGPSSSGPSSSSTTASPSSLLSSSVTTAAATVPQFPIASAASNSHSHFYSSAAVTIHAPFHGPELMTSSPVTHPQCSHHSPSSSCATRMTSMALPISTLQEGQPAILSASKTLPSATRIFDHKPQQTEHGVPWNFISAPQTTSVQPSLQIMRPHAHADTNSCKICLPSISVTDTANPASGYIGVHQILATQSHCAVDSPRTEVSYCGGHSESASAKAAMQTICSSVPMLITEQESTKLLCSSQAIPGSERFLTSAADITANNANVACGISTPVTDSSVDNICIPQKLENRHIPNASHCYTSIVSDDQRKPLLFSSDCTNYTAQEPANQDTISTREIPPTVECVSKPVVQIFLPHSRTSTSHCESVGDACLAPVKEMKKRKLNTVMHKNRTRILNILKSQNKVGTHANDHLDLKRDSANGCFLKNPCSIIPAECSGIFKEAATAAGSTVQNTLDSAVVKLSDFEKDCCKQRERNSETNLQRGQRVQLEASDSDVDISGFDQEDQDSTDLSNTCKESDLKDKNEGLGGLQLLNNEDKMNISSQYVHSSGSVVPDPGGNSCKESPLQAAATSIMSSPSSKWVKMPSNNSTPIKSAKIHNVRRQGELLYVPVGTSFKSFIQEHPLIQGICLHKGKREIKKQLIHLCRQCPHSDGRTSWHRGKEILERNRFDDFFELTEDGKREQEEVIATRKRDQYVVNWYVWCPGHGNCLRKCGGFGSCVEGCKGMQHKQDRHNCSLMINMKLFLSDLTTWRVHITGSHVPPGSSLIWSPPLSKSKQSSHDHKHQGSAEKSKKLKLSLSTMKTDFGEENPAEHSNTAAVVPLPSVSENVDNEWNVPCANSMWPNNSAVSNMPMLSPKISTIKPQTAIPSKKRISKMLSNLKRRRKERMISCKTVLPSVRGPSFTLSHGQGKQMGLHNQGNGDNSEMRGLSEFMSNTNAGHPLETGTTTQHILKTPLQISDLKTIQKQHLSPELLSLLEPNLNKATTQLTGEDVPEHNWALPIMSKSPENQQESFIIPDPIQMQAVATNNVCLGGTGTDVQMPTLSHGQASKTVLSCEGPSQVHHMKQLNWVDNENVVKVSMNQPPSCTGESALRRSQMTDTVNLESEIDQPFLNAHTLTDILQQVNTGCQNDPGEFTDPFTVIFTRDMPQFSALINNYLDNSSVTAFMENATSNTTSSETSSIATARDLAHFLFHCTANSELPPSLHHCTANATITSGKLADLQQQQLQQQLRQQQLQQHQKQQQQQTPFLNIIKSVHEPNQTYQGLDLCSLPQTLQPIPPPILSKTMAASTSFPSTQNLACHPQVSGLSGNITDISKLSSPIFSTKSEACVRQMPSVEGNNISDTANTSLSFPSVQNPACIPQISCLPGDTPEISQTPLTTTIISSDQPSSVITGTSSCSMCHPCRALETTSAGSVTSTEALPSYQEAAAALAEQLRIQWTSQLL